MTATELIAKLSEFPPDEEVLICYESYAYGEIEEVEMEFLPLDGKTYLVIRTL